MRIAALVEVAGAYFPYPVHGRSLVRILREGRDESWPDETFSELVDHRGGTPLPSRMIRSGPWKLWTYADEQNLPPALFDLQNDPGELNDLGEDADYAEIRNRLLKRIYEEWNPKEAARKSQEYRGYFDLLGQWGQTVKPESSDAMVYPPSEYEEDVELL
jgi:arylsulfatase A-like enzyme